MKFSAGKGELGFRWRGRIGGDRVMGRVREREGGGRWIVFRGFV